MTTTMEQYAQASIVSRQARDPPRVDLEITSDEVVTQRPRFRTARTQDNRGAMPRPVGPFAAAT